MLLSNAAGGANSLGSLIFTIILMVVIFYFLMVRPQSKEKKRIDDLLASVEIGDAIVTTSGFYGIVIDIKGDDVIVEFGCNKNCRISMKKSAIAEVEKQK